MLMPAFALTLLNNFILVLLVHVFQFGEVLNLVMSVKKSGTAIVELSSPYMAVSLAF